MSAKDVTVGVVGLGYVGLPLAIRFAEVGFRVVGFDIDQSKITSLKNGESYIRHISTDKLANLVLSGATFQSEFEGASACDVIIICVPTPLTKHREPDLRFVTETCEQLLPHLRKGQVMILESTTYPGTTEEELLPRIESTGLEVGKDISLVYSPEREDPGNINFETRNIPKVVGGHTPDCLDVGVALYSHVIDVVVPVSSTKVAELTKLLENIHRAVNIGLVNEMKMLTDKMGIDIFEVIDAAATKPFGFTAYYPGPGLGGHCIPIDPYYLTWKAKEYGLHTRFIELSGEVNRSMPEYVVAKVSSALNTREKALLNSKILVLGIAYKKNVDDMRESPAVEIMELLREKGVDVAYSDPHVSVFPKMREHSFDLTSVELSPQSLSKFDAVVLTTDHDSFDYQMISENADLIVDSRGIYRGNNNKVFKA